MRNELNQKPHLILVFLPTLCFVDIMFLIQAKLQPAKRERLASDTAKQLNGFDQVNYPTWESILTQIDQRMPTGACLILDEFPLPRIEQSRTPSVIQRLLDTNRIQNLHIILCGSSQRMMLNLAMGANEPLYGRSQLIMKVRPLECGWIRKALKYDSRTSIEAYSILGGTPPLLGTRSKLRFNRGLYQGTHSRSRRHPPRRDAKTPTRRSERLFPGDFAALPHRKRLPSTFGIRVSTRQARYAIDASDKQSRGAWIRSTRNPLR